MVSSPCGWLWSGARGARNTFGRRKAIAPGVIPLYSYLAMFQAEQLDRAFHALSDGTRRAILHELAGGEPRSAGELGQHFRSAQPTISKHLRVLEDAQLIERTVDGRVHWFRLQPKGLREATRWLARHQAFWEGAVDQLEQLLSQRSGRGDT
ncbi:MAG TPA: metalloregulator ArsR/SmtB family transcription factor [Steroidobacteraceae bacterium]|nr:metalloregulator ArsR/SmtB family transcription factor [Steroidobacteraceae bacterium]